MAPNPARATGPTNRLGCAATRVATVTRRSRFASLATAWSFAIVIIVAAPGPANAQCAAPIIDDSTISRRFTVTPWAATVWDRDGEGPGLGELVISSMRSVGLSRGGAWSYLAHFATTELEQFTTWDPDGEGPLQTLLLRYHTSIKTWDGVAWGSMPTTGLPETIRSLVSWDRDGPGGDPPVLVASAYGGSMNGVFERVGTSWVRMGTLTSASQLVSHDPDGIGPKPPELYAGGWFDLPGPSGIVSQGVMKWEGTEWVVPGAGLNKSVQTLVSWDRDGNGPIVPYLVAGGTFNASGTNTTIKNLAKWNGSTWTLVSSGSPQAVTALAKVILPDSGLEALVVGGKFTTIGPISANRIATFDGTTWCALGEGLSYSPKFITTWKPTGPLAGSFNVYTDLGTFDGTRWSTASNTHGLWDTKVGGVWDADGDGPGLAKLVVPAVGGYGEVRLITWNGLEWGEHDLGVPYGRAMSVAQIDLDGSGPAGQDLILGGYFPWAGVGPAFNHIGVFDGESFEPLGEGFRAAPPNHAFVTSLAAWDPDGDGPEPQTLFAGGEFTHSGSTELNRIASWSGSEWRPLGPGLSDAPAKMLPWDPDENGPESTMLLVGGSFSVKNTPGVGVLALWDGFTWNAFPGPTPGGISQMSIWDPDGPGPEASAPVTNGFGSSDNYCDGLGWCETTYDQSFRRWTGAEWTRVIGTRSSWHCDERGCCGDLYGISAVQNWDPDGPGPRNPVIAFGGQINEVGTIYPYGADSTAYPFPWRLESWYDDGSYCAYDDTEVHDLVAFDPDGAAGPVNPILCVLASFQWYAGPASQDIPGYHFARFMDGPPAFLIQPREVESAFHVDIIGLEARALGPGPVTYQWYKDGAPLTVGPSGSGAVIHEAQAPTLVMSAVTDADNGEYWCVATNACASTESAHHTLDVSGSGDHCEADYNADTTVDILDLLDFVADFADCQGLPAPCGIAGDTDRNADTIVDIVDFLDFFAAFSGGCD